MNIKAFCQIAAPKSKVFELFSDLHNLSNYVTAITKIEILTKGEIGVGSKFKETRLMFGSESTEVMEITQFLPFDTFREEARSGGMHYISDWVFTEVDGITTVKICFTGTATTFNGKIINLIFTCMKIWMKKAFITDMNELKQVLENDV